MEYKTNKEIADWLYERIMVGRGEEIGSFDSVEINGHDLVIEVDLRDEGHTTYEAYIDLGAVWSSDFSTYDTAESVLSNVEADDVAKILWGE